MSVVRLPKPVDVAEVVAPGAGRPWPEGGARGGGHPGGRAGRRSRGVGVDGRWRRRGPELAAGIQVEGVYGGGGYLGGDGGGAVHADADPVSHQVDGADLA